MIHSEINHGYMTPVSVPSLPTLTVANSSAQRFLIRDSIEISFSSSHQRFLFNSSQRELIVQAFLLTVVFLSRTLVKTRTLFLASSDSCWRSVSDSSHSPFILLSLSSDK